MTVRKAKNEKKKRKEKKVLERREKERAWKPTRNRGGNVEELGRASAESRDRWIDADGAGELRRMMLGRRSTVIDERHHETVEHNSRQRKAWGHELSPCTRKVQTTHSGE